MAGEPAVAGRPDAVAKHKAVDPDDDRRRRSVEFVNCPCSGKSLAKLLHPAILVCLARGPAHGYAILQQLAEMKMFADDEPDHAGVYRTLKQMESQGYVESQWDVQVEAGPARRVFSLTETGMACLRRWLETLERYRDAIDGLLGQMGTLPGVR